jgi:excisionase family DNA binding protein
MSRIYTVKEAADVLGISTRRVQELAAELDPPPKKFGRSWALSSDDLQRLRELHELKRKSRRKQS